VRGDRLSKVVVTTKANGNDVDVFSVDSHGSLSARPVVNSEPNTVPFAFAFDAQGLRDRFGDRARLRRRRGNRRLLITGPAHPAIT